MGILYLDKDADNYVANQYSDARGPVIRGEHTELALIHFNVGEGARTHSHLEEQFVVVLKGCIRFETADDIQEVRPGQAYFIPAGVPHATTMLEDTTAISFKNLVNPAYKATSSAIESESKK